MVKRVFLLFGIFCLLINSACKKKDKPDETPASSGGTPIASSYFGILTTGNYTTVSSGLTFVSSSARAYFSNREVVAMDLTKAINISSVFLNGDSLTFDKTLKYYIPANPVNLATKTWSVNGSNGIPTFSYVNTLPFPEFDNTVAMPDSVSKSKGFTLSINGVNNTTNASLIVVDGTNTATGFFSAILNKGNNTVSFGSAELQKLLPGANGRIAVVLENATVMTFNSKNFKFVSEAQFTKQVKITP